MRQNKKYGKSPLKTRSAVTMRVIKNLKWYKVSLKKLDNENTN